MKLPPFDFSTSSWDGYRQQHMKCYGGHQHVFTRFSTDELICTGYHMSANARRRYHQFDLQILSTADKDAMQSLTFTTPDGEAVPHAWLTQGGGQSCLIDWGCRMMVSTRNAYVYKPPEKNPLAVPLFQCVPLWLRNKSISIYWPGEATTPMPQCKITLCRPFKLTAEDRDHIRELQAAAAARVALMDLVKKRTRFQQVSVMDLVNHIETPADLTNEMCMYLKSTTPQPSRVNQLEPYLNVITK